MCVYALKVYKPRTHKSKVIRSRFKKTLNLSKARSLMWCAVISIWSRFDRMFWCLVGLNESRRSKAYLNQINLGSARQQNRSNN